MMPAWKKVLYAILCGFLAIFIQGALVQSILPSWFISPNLVLILVAFLAFHEVSVLGAVVAFVLGLQLDFSSGLLLGPHAAAFSAVYALLSSISQRVFIGSPVAGFLAVFAVTPVASITYLALEYQFKPIEFPIWTFVLKIVAESFLNAMLAPMLFAPLSHIFRDPQSGPRRGGSL